MSSPNENEQCGLEQTPSLDSMTTESTNPWDTNPGLNRWSMICSLRESDNYENKIEFLKKEVADGHCYLWLVLYIEKVLEQRLDVFVEFIVKFKDACKKTPYCNEAIEQLLLLCMTLIYPTDTNLSGRSLSIELVNHMMTSPMRMKISGEEILHIEPSNDYFLGCGCDPKDVYCDHGLASRYIMTVVTMSKKKLGATINFDDVEFEEDFEETQTHFTAETPTPKPLNIPAKEPRDTASKVTLDPSQFPNAPHKDLKARVGETQFSKLRRDSAAGNKPNYRYFADNVQGIDSLGRLSGIVTMASEAAKAYSRADSREKRSSQQKYVNAVRDVIQEMEEMGLGSETDDETALDPDDSSSNFGIRNRKAGSYMKQGTVIDDGSQRSLRRAKTESTMTGSTSALTRRSQQTVGPLLRSQDLRAGSIVAGFLKDESMIRLETEIAESIGEINGLADPLKSDRLMLLMHIHTGLSTRKIDVSDQESLFIGLEKIVRSRGRSASERLLQLVIEATFDHNRLVVVSNIFKLPYIEIGMRISGAMLVKCFDQLQMEYEILWFDQFKGLRVPDFHSKFLKISEEDPRDKSKSSTQQKSQKHTSDKSQRKKSSSILSFRT